MPIEKKDGKSRMPENSILIEKIMPVLLVVLE